MASKQKTVYILVKGKEDKTFFNRAGVAFENRDGSLNVKLDIFPNVTFQIRDTEDNANRDTRGG